jgi:hypothetical protein
VNAAVAVRAMRRRRLGLDTPPWSVWIHVTDHVTAGQFGDPGAEMCPHVKLHFLRDAQLLVEKLSHPASASRPGLDREHQIASSNVPRPELDLSGLHVTAQRREPEGNRCEFHHPDRAIPGPWHVNDVLVSHSQGAGDARGLVEDGDLHR